MNARDEILARIRDANTLAGGGGGNTDHLREYRTAGSHLRAADELESLMIDRLTDYRANVHRCSPENVSATVAAIAKQQGFGSIVVPDGIDPAWHDGLSAVTVHHDHQSLSWDELDQIDAALTTATVAIAETGTIVLDGSAGQGRRVLSLIPDHHVLIVRHDQIVQGVAEALEQLIPTKPQTWISGPSATSDIELIRIEGVHGPRHLHVVLVTGAA